MKKQSLLLLLALPTLTHAGCRTTTSTQSITCTPTSCTPRYDGGCSDDEYQQDSTQTFCNVEGDTTTCGYSVICCVPQSTSAGAGGGGMMVPQSSSTSSSRGGTCGNGNRGNGICPIEGECCSEHGWCGTSSEHCSGSSSSTTTTTSSGSSSSSQTSDWWDPNSSTRYSDMYTPTWNGQPLPSSEQQQQQQQQFRSSPNDYTRAASPTVQTAGAGAGLGFAFVVIVIAACYTYRREQNKADCPGGIPTAGAAGGGAGRVGGGVLDPDGGSLAMRYGIDSSDEDGSSSEDEEDGGGRSRRSKKVGRDPSVYGQISTNGEGGCGKSTSRRKSGRDPSVTFGSNSNGSGSGSGSGGSKRRVVVVDDDARSHRSSTKSSKQRSRDPSINNGSNNGSGSGSGSGSGRPPAPTVNGRSPRLQGQTGALLNRADPLSLSGSGPTTALNIMRRSGARSNSDATSRSGDASHNQDGGVPRSVVTSVVSPPSSVTPVISNVDSRHAGINGDRNGNSDVPPATSMEYSRGSQIHGFGPGAGGGYPQYANAHDIHRARWEQEQRELAADYYPSVNNYPFDFYNSPGSMGMYYQQQLSQPPPASFRYHRQQQLPSDTTNAAADDRLAMEHRLQVEQQRLQEFYQPRVPHHLPPSMVVLPQQAQAAQLQQQQLMASQIEGGGAHDFKHRARSSSSSSPGVSSAYRNQIHQQMQRSGSPGMSSAQRNQIHQQLQRSGSPGVSSVQRNQVHHRTHSLQQQQTPHAYEERDWRTNQVWREDDHSHTASLGGLKIPTPPPPAINTTERGSSDKPSTGLPSVTSLPPRLSQQPGQQQGRVSGSMTIDQYDVTHTQMYGQYMQGLQQQQQQQQPPHVSATPSPPPAPSSTPMMTGIDPRIQHQMNLMAMMFQHQHQGGGIPPPHMSPIPRGLMYPPQYYPPQHNIYQGGIPGAVGHHPPKEVIVPTPSVTEAGEEADLHVPFPSQDPEPAVAPPPPVLREKSSKTKVSFSTLQIRTYETILGDNPSCTGGPPISIGWRYNPEHFDSTVDEYERKQDHFYGGPEIRPLDIDLVLHRSERESILMKMGYNQQDLAESVRRLNKAKSRRRQTVHNLPVMFLEEKAESCKRTMGRLFLNRQRTRHMYDEWKKGDKSTPRETRRNSV